MPTFPVPHAREQGTADEHVNQDGEGWKKKQCAYQEIGIGIRFHLSSLQEVLPI